MPSRPSRPTAPSGEGRPDPGCEEVEVRVPRPGKRGATLEDLQSTAPHGARWSISGAPAGGRCLQNHVVEDYLLQRLASFDSVVHVCERASADLAVLRPPRLHPVPVTGSAGSALDAAAAAALAKSATRSPSDATSTSKRRRSAATANGASGGLNAIARAHAQRSASAAAFTTHRSGRERVRRSGQALLSARPPARCQTP
jgi:hypothetical protein